MRSEQVVKVIETTVPIRTEITVEMVEDILIAAFEGGSNYWITGIEYDEIHKGGAIAQVPRGGWINIETYEDGKVLLDLPRFIDGLKMACSFYGVTPDDFYEGHDAEMADVLVQFAVFGEIVYG